MSRKAWGGAAPWIVLALVLAGALAFTVVRSRPSHSPEARASRLAHELRCPTCQNESVASSQSDAAVGIRADIAARIAKGQSDARIEQAYVDRYGEWVLLSPQGSGIGLLAWGLPVAAILVAAGVLAVALVRWNREPRLAASDADARLVARERGRGS